MTPQEWRDVEASLSHPYGRVRLQADGHVLTLSVEKGKGLRYVIAAYIDGVIEWNLMFSKDDGPYRKFWRPRKSYLYSAAERAELTKRSRKRGMHKELRASYASMATAASELFDPLWPNAKALCRHLRKTCSSIERLPDFEPQGAAA
ncbi:hypothetical protein dqs_0597 [Azoarcus olearius]|uniref:hypothetical protein n=1 Tax=Azoarcus sp. (strain BH72) TaxID=418699 RepID=UPI00080637FA|nr:hypothetical protein [Azoarcus olearius]ANQ83673.1 hypothetical protein dqs_0597 [Azoarcus olearius]